MTSGGIIPITFEYKGQQIAGQLTTPHGAGGNVWFLMIDDFFRGQLIRTNDFGWRFSSTDRRFEDMADYFSQVVIAWYE